METLILAAQDSPGLEFNTFNNMQLSLKQALSGLHEAGTKFEVQVKGNQGPHACHLPRLLSAASLSELQKCSKEGPGFVLPTTYS